MLDLYTMWRRLSALPGGRWLFSRGAGMFAPYTGTMNAEVLELAPRHARVKLPDHHRVRNHLKSIHAVAMVNLVEMTGSLALMAALPDAGNMIPIHLEIDYLKKARGDLVAECEVAPFPLDADNEVSPEVIVRDMAGVEVARARLRCRIRAARN
jgi:uncharacterized protein (TIGR00369 family)